MKLYGRNPVLERLKANPHSIKKIFMKHGHEEAAYISKKAKKNGIPVHFIPLSKVQKLARNINTQGILADIDDFAYMPFDEALGLASGNKAVLLFLDSLQDPQNLGAILRNLACLGNFVIVLPTHKSVSVTEAVLRVACGGENYIPVVKVPNLARAIRSAREKGIWIMASIVGGGEDIHTVSWQFPLGLIVGSEQKGVRDVLRKLVDRDVSIPMAQSRLSLNAAHATTLFCYEIVRQQGSKINK